MEKIDKDYGLTYTQDPEIKQRWFPLGIYQNYTPVFDYANQFVCQQGRLKYLNPIYIALKDTNLTMGQEWF